MKSLKVLVMFVLALAITLSAAAPLDDLDEEESFFSEENGAKEETYDDLPILAKSQDEETTSLRGISRFLASQGAVTCDKNPKVCGVGAAAGSHKYCCHKKCVNLKTDRANCGKCGVKCNHSEICCNGHVVNPFSDKKHCGSCDNHCKKGIACDLGICGYA